MTDPEKPSQPVEPPSGAERSFVVIALLLSTGAFQNLWLDTHSAVTQDASPVGTSITGLIYLIALFLLIRHCKGFIQLFLREWPLVAMAGFAIASAFWSEVPEISFRHGIGLLLTFLFGAYFALRYSPRDQVRLLAWVLGICLIFSFIFGVLGVGTSLDTDIGVVGWYGVFTQKNSLGNMMVLSVLVFLHWKRIEPEHSGLASIGLMGSLVLVTLSQSMTSIIAVVLLLVLMPYLRWTARKGVRWVAAGFTFLAAAGAFSLAYVATHLPEVTALLGKSVTLTGRLQLWVFSFVMAVQRPWLGYGYDAFWMNDAGAIRIQHAAGWSAPHSHNGFLEIWLGLGLCGLGVFLFGFARYVWRSLKFLPRRPLPEATWPLLFLTVTFVTNITQVTLLYRNSINMVLYASISLLTAPGSVGARKRLVVATPVRSSALLT